MKKYNGTVTKSDLEGGVWLLKTDSGETYELKGASESILKEGLKISIDGQVQRDMMSFAMMGPVLSVKSHKLI